MWPGWVCQVRSGNPPSVTANCVILNGVTAGELVLIWKPWMPLFESATQREPGPNTTAPKPPYWGFELLLGKLFWSSITGSCVESATLKTLTNCGTAEESKPASNFKLGL